MLVTVAGYVALGVVAARLLTYLSKYLKSPLTVTKLGEWALVTGATDGIGESCSALQCPAHTPGTSNISEEEKKIVY